MTELKHARSQLFRIHAFKHISIAALVCRFSLPVSSSETTVDQAWAALDKKQQ